MMVTLFIGFAIFAAIDAAEVELCKAQHSCKLEPVGCFDDQHKRAMPEEILNERDGKSNVFRGRWIDWENFGSYLQEFSCRCAKIASAKGYTVIGLQFYGECWSGPNAHHTYDMYGPSEKCVDSDFRLMPDSSTCRPYVGSQWSNYVYRIATLGCADHQIEPVGCFHDDLVSPRPLPNYIMTERDYSHKGWNGKLIDWKHWDKYSPQLICRCADAASKLGHTYFAIQFWGECWSGTNANVQYQRNGGSSKCVNEYFKSCACNSYNCVGMAYTNYVYKLHGRVKCNKTQHNVIVS